MRGRTAAAVLAACVITAGCGAGEGGVVLCSHIYYEGEILAAIGPAGDEPWLVMLRYDGTGGGLVGPGPFRYPAASRDHLRMSFARGGYGPGGTLFEIHVTEDVFCTERRLTRASARGLSAGRHAWSPDGATVVYEAGGDLWAIPGGGGAERRLTEGPEADDHPTWSQDGTRIAFQRDGDVWVMDADGSSATLLVRGARSPAWSPHSLDGRRIAFVSLVAPGGIRTIEDDGSEEPFGDPQAPLGDDLAWGANAPEIATLFGDLLVLVGPASWRSHEVTADPRAEAWGIALR